MATNHIQISVAGGRQDTYVILQKMAEKLGCRVTDLVWHAIGKVLENPPQAVAGTGAAFAPRTGIARGFWVRTMLDERTGRLRGIDIVEVAKRSDLDGGDGSTFLRYKQGDAKGRLRSLKQAIKMAEYNAKMAGLKVPEGGLAIQELPDKQGKAVAKAEEKAAEPTS